VELIGLLSNPPDVAAGLHEGSFWIGASSTRHGARFGATVGHGEGRLCRRRLGPTDEAVSEGSITLT
jgi:hypothetical protein